MNKNHLSISTISWARNEGEENLLKKSLQILAGLHLPVFITDGGSSQSFLDFLNSFTNFTISKAPAKGVWAQAKSSLEAAYQSGSDFVFYTEPDKFDFFHRLPAILDKVNLAPQSGIVMMSRSPSAFSSFPAFQQMTETTINNCCAEVISDPVDYTYGPFIVNRKIVPYLISIKEELDWGWRPYAFSIARRLGYIVEAIEGDFNCPPDQQSDTPEERLYRMRQLQQNIHGIVLSKTVEL